MGVLVKRCEDNIIWKSAAWVSTVKGRSLRSQTGAPSQEPRNTLPPFMALPLLPSPVMGTILASSLWPGLHRAGPGIQPGGRQGWASASLTRPPVLGIGVRGPRRCSGFWGNGDVGEEPQGPVSAPPGHLTAEAVALEAVYGPAQQG